MFESLQQGLQGALKSLRGKGKLTEANMRDGLRLVEQSLLDRGPSLGELSQIRCDHRAYGLLVGIKVVD